MAHLLVYLQRTPHGIHPASALATCLARDLGSARGATVTGLCFGDAGDFDEHVARAAGRCGADTVIFVGPRGLETAVARLRPKHVLIPWTSEATQAVAQVGLGEPVARWVGGPQDPPDQLDPVTGLVAGALPWRHESPDIEPEYEGDVGEATVPEWAAQTGGALYRDDARFYVGPPDLDPTVEAALEKIQAKRMDPDYAEQHTTGTLFWLDAGPSGLPEPLVNRPEQARVVLLPGPSGTPTPGWGLADYVIPGPWLDVVSRLDDEDWGTSLA